MVQMKSRFLGGGGNTVKKVRESILRSKMSFAGSSGNFLSSSI